ESDVCSQILVSFEQIWSYFGITLAKDETYLGIVIDTVKGEFRLPVEKAVKCRKALAAICSKKNATVKEVASLLGLLAFASRVIPMGRVFFRWLSMLVAWIRNPSFHVCFSREIKEEDLEVWFYFYLYFYGKVVWRDHFMALEDMNLFTLFDVSGLRVFGAFWRGNWHVARWHQAWVKNRVMTSSTSCGNRGWT
ncbi:unnamed protein product, partial [Ranitomeya imitator]